MAKPRTKLTELNLWKDSWIKRASFWHTKKGENLSLRALPLETLLGVRSAYSLWWIHFFSDQKRRTYHATRVASYSFLSNWRADSIADDLHEMSSKPMRRSVPERKDFNHGHLTWTLPACRTKRKNVYTAGTWTSLKLIFNLKDWLTAFAFVSPRGFFLGRIKTMSETENGSLRSSEKVMVLVKQYQWKWGLGAKRFRKKVESSKICPTFCSFCRKQGHDLSICKASGNKKQK